MKEARESMTPGHTHKCDCANCHDKALERIKQLEAEVERLRNREKGLTEDCDAALLRCEELRECLQIFFELCCKDKEETSHYCSGCSSADKLLSKPPAHYQKKDEAEDPAITGHAGPCTDECKKDKP